MKNEMLFSLQVIFTCLLSVIGFATTGAFYLIGCLAFGYAAMRLSPQSIDKEEHRHIKRDFLTSTWTAMLIALFPSAVFNSSGYLHKCAWLLGAGIVCWSVGMLFGLAKNREEKSRAMAATPENMPLVA